MKNCNALATGSLLRNKWRKLEMDKILDELKEYDLSVRENDSPDRLEIDFIIEDGEDNAAFVWGDTFDDLEWECNHPNQCIEFGDTREEQGECLLCGSWCDWHRTPDENGNGYPEPHEWYPRSNVGGLIGKYLKELQDENV